MVSLFFRGCSLGSILHNLCLLAHLSDYLFSIHPLTHFSAHIHLCIYIPACPRMWLDIHLSNLSSSVYHPFLSPSFLFSSYPSVCLYPFIYPHSSCSHPPTYSLCSLTFIYALTSANRLLFLPVIPIHLSRSIHTAFIHHPTFSFTQLCNRTLPIHVCHPPTHPSSIHLSIIYLYHLPIYFLYVYPYKFHNTCFWLWIHFDKETAMKGLICLPFSPIKLPGSFKWTGKWLCISLIG